MGQRYTLMEGGTLSYTVDLDNGRTAVIEVTVVKGRRTDTVLEVDAYMALPQPDKHIRLVPEADRGPGKPGLG